MSANRGTWGFFVVAILSLSSIALFALAIASPTPAEARILNSHCDPGGDFCTSVGRVGDPGRYRVSWSIGGEKLGPALAFKLPAGLRPEFGCPN